MCCRDVNEPLASAFYSPFNMVVIEGEQENKCTTIQ